FTLFGISAIVLFLRNFVVTNPDLYADFPGCSIRFNKAVINIGFQRMQWGTAFFILLGTRQFSTAETAAGMNFYAIYTHIHSSLNGFLHSTTKTNTSFQLHGYIFGNQLCIGFSASDFANVDNYLFI